MEKDAPLVDSPQHDLIYESLEILDWFALWRVSARLSSCSMLAAKHAHLYFATISRCPTSKQKADLETRGLDLETHFFPRELWEDLNSMVLGFACACRFYLLEDGTHAWAQRRGNQDACEHHFASVRQGGSTQSTSLHAARGKTAWAGDMSLQRSSGSNNASAPIDEGLALSAPPQVKK